jgi:hypothetical protein
MWAEFKVAELRVQGRNTATILGFHKTHLDSETLKSWRKAFHPHLDIQFRSVDYNVRPEIREN